MYDCFRPFQTISMINPELMGYNIENRATFITNFKVKEEEIIVWTWEKGK